MRASCRRHLMLERPRARVKSAAPHASPAPSCCALPARSVAANRAAMAGIVMLLVFNLLWLIGATESTGTLAPVLGNVALPSLPKLGAAKAAGEAAAPAAAPAPATPQVRSTFSFKVSALALAHACCHCRRGARSGAGVATRGGGRVAEWEAKLWGACAPVRCCAGGGAGAAH